MNTWWRKTQCAFSPYLHPFVKQQNEHQTYVNRKTVASIRAACVCLPSPQAVPPCLAGCHRENECVKRNRRAGRRVEFWWALPRRGLGGKTEAGTLALRRRWDGWQHQGAAASVFCVEKYVVREQWRGADTMAVFSLEDDRRKRSLINANECPEAWKDLMRMNVKENVTMNNYQYFENLSSVHVSFQMNQGLPFLSTTKG